MKIIMTIIILGMTIRGLVVMPAATLPVYPVHGTEKIQQWREEKAPAELRYMSEKMYYLKTGKIIRNEENRRHQQNFWGRGIPAQTRFPSHLAMWEETRRKPKTGRS